MGLSESGAGIPGIDRHDQGLATFSFDLLYDLIMWLFLVGAHAALWGDCSRISSHALNHLRSYVSRSC